MAEETTPSGNGIWIAGEFFALSGGVKCVTFKEAPEWDEFSAKPPGGEYDKVWAERSYKDSTGAKKKAATLDDLRTAVEVIILHTDGLNNAKQTHQTLLNKGLSTHFIVDWDGTIYQTLDPLYAGYHAAEQNFRSIGIDMNNDLPELHGKDKGKEYPYGPGQTDPKFKRPVSELMEIQGSKKQSYGYTDPQYTACIELLKVLCDTLNIAKQPPLDEKGEVVNRMLDDAMGFKGFAAHWHTSPTRWDPGPGFDWMRVYHALRGEHNSFPVVIEEKQNVAELLAPDKVFAAAQKVYQNNEMGGGGYFPIGLNQNWHGGVHFVMPRGTEVHAMMDGVLVAARFGNKTSVFGDRTPLGHNNFVLLRHEIPMPKTPTLRVFSLYMHLDDMEVDPANPKYEWVRQALRVYKGEDELTEEALDMGATKDEVEKEKEKEEAEAAAADKELGQDEGKRASEVKPCLEIGYKLGGLRSGAVALFDIEPVDRQIKVKAGEVIGGVGEFGETGEAKAQVHVEVFADESWKKSIDMGVHSRHWVEVAEDVESNLRVETEDILNLFQTSGNRRKHNSFFRQVQRQVLPAEVEEFYSSQGDNEKAKDWLRKAITRHVSEWSDQVDWVKALVKGQTWADKVREVDTLFQDRTGAYRMGIFSAEIRKFLPFIWLTQEVAEHIGLAFKEWTGVVYHFHPVHFMLWLTYNSSSRVKALSTGKSMKQLKKEADKVRKAEEASRIEGKLDREMADDWSSLDQEEFTDSIEETSPTEVLKDYWGKRAPDEWEPPRAQSEES